LPLLAVQHSLVFICDCHKSWLIIL
jgi:hypothetical protein